MVKKTRIIFVLLIISLTTCVGRSEILNDEIFIEHDGILEKAHGSTLSIDNKGETTLINVIFPWSHDISIANDLEWINTQIVSASEPYETPDGIDNNRLTNYYVATISITVDSNTGKSRSGTITLSCDYRNDICISNIIIKQEGN